MDLLAFDLGASSGKTFHGVFDGQNISLEPLNRFNHAPIDVNGELFWNILGIFEHFRTGIRKANSIGKNIISIGMDSFSNDFGLLDNDGYFINQVHCYRDSRTKRNAKKIYSMIPKQKLYQLSGNQNALFTPLMQFASMCLEKQAYLLQGAGSFLFLPDLFTYFLTGEIASEYTISSVSQMFNFPLNDWSDEIIDTFAFPRNIFPQIVQPGTIVGKIEKSSGLTNGNRKIAVVSVCEHDTASAFLAAPHGSDSIIISSGTWSLVGIESASHVINDFGYEHNIANEGGFPGHHRLLKNVMGLWLVQECQRYFLNNGTEHSIGDFIELAEKAKPMQCLINPNDEIFFSPGNMPQKIMSYCGQHGQNVPETPGEIIRCIFESLAFHYRYVIEEIEAISEKEYSSINIVGGGCLNTMLNQLTANVTNRCVYAGPDEATALGNLMVQLIAHGEIASVEEGREIIKRSFRVREYTPNDSDLWHEKYQAYLKIVRS